MTKSNFFFPFLLLLLLSSTSLLAESRAKDSLNLIKIHNALNGEDWKVKWNFTQPLTDWYGVRVIEGRVKHLSLYGNNLRGQLPDEIGYLTGLLSLNIGNNHFDGNLPATIEYLDDLERLFAQNAGLSGPLPAEIGLLDNLAYLGLKNNRISGELPETFGLLPKLVSVYLDENQIVGTVPTSMATMDSLKVISITDNYLNAPIDRSFAKSDNMRALKLNNNRLTFNDILPIRSMINQLNRCGHHMVSYDEQAILQLPATLELYPKQSTLIKIPEVVNNNGNVYKWFKDGEFLEIRYANDFTIKRMDGFKEGKYSCEISNPSVPNLILNTTEVQVIKKEWNGEEYSNQIMISGGLNIFPNPTDGEFSYTFSNEETGNYTVTVSDVLGRTYHNEEITKVESGYKGDITIAGLSSGIYLLTIQNDASKFSGKITIIQRD